MEVALDLSGEFLIISLQSQVWKEKRNRILFRSEIFKQKEDSEMYGQLPDCDELKWCDMGIDTYLSRIAEKIDSNFRKPSWGI